MRVFIAILEPFQSPVLFLAAVAALADAALLAADAFFFPPAMAVCRRLQEHKEEDDGVVEGVKNGTAGPYLLFIEITGDLSHSNFYPSYVSHILATTWRKDTNRQTAVISARSSRHGVPKFLPLRGRNCPTMA